MASESIQYFAVITGINSCRGIYQVHTKSAGKATIKYGRREDGETVSVYSSKSDLLSRVKYFADGKYYRCAINKEGYHV